MCGPGGGPGRARKTRAASWATPTAAVKSRALDDALFTRLAQRGFRIAFAGMILPPKWTPSNLINQNLGKISADSLDEI